MEEEPKILEDVESTYRNGGGSMCGGVISESRFNSDPMGNMMAYYMEDDKFEIYKKLKQVREHQTKNRQESGLRNMPRVQFKR